MSRAVVWDMGGIMYRFFTELVLDLGRRRGWPVDRLPLGPTGRGADPDYERMLRGDIGEHEYLERVRAGLRAEAIEFDPLRELHWAGQERAETWKTIRTLHEHGIRQAVLTNDASKWLGERWLDTWEPASWFEAMIDVATLGVRKPDPGPYLAAAEALGLPPAECLFVDDLPVNCRGAEAVGMASHWFDITRPADSLTALLQRLDI
ncbi:MAG: HAD-IA family hydrolase [Acidimicrobiales bacterium]